VTQWLFVGKESGCERASLLLLLLFAEGAQAPCDFEALVFDSWHWEDISMVLVRVVLTRGKPRLLWLVRWT